jgi:PAT family beta-lactamase induction signal transducer AmpG
LRFFKKQFLDIFILGIAAGVPLALVLSSLTVWLKEYGISKSAISLFALTTTPYALKFLWSPFIDGIKLPFFSNKFGQRKAWLILTQILLFGAIFSMGLVNPNKHLYLMAICTLCVSFFSASQDIVIDAYRIENFEKKEQGLAASFYIYGYRIGLLVSGAAALIIAEFVGFNLTYIFISFLYFAFAIFSFFLPEKIFQTKAPSSYKDWCKSYIITPFAQLMKEPHFVMVILFIITFKFGDAFIGIMTNPFLLEIGFSKIDIAFYVKTVGLFATITGALAGGILIAKYSLKTNLYIAAVFQLLTNLIFIIQAMVGNKAIVLGATIFLENFAGGIGTIVFVAFLSSLCHVKFSATQYALLSSIAAVSRTFLSAPAGFVAESYSWVEFFLISGIISIPAIIFIYFLRLKSHQN